MKRSEWILQWLIPIKSGARKKNWWSNIMGIQTLIDAHGEKSLGCLFRSHRRATLAQITEKINVGHNRKLSEHTMHHNMRLRRHRPVRVPRMTSVHHQKNLQWSWECQNWTTEQWKKVACSGEPFIRSVGWQMRVSFTWGKYGSRMHYGKKADGGSVLHWTVFCCKRWVLKFRWMLLWHVPPT